MSKTSGILGAIGISICLIAIMFQGTSSEAVVPNQVPIVNVVDEMTSTTITKVVDLGGVFYVATCGTHPPSIFCVSRTQ